MNTLQELIYNEGERLVPYVSHDDAELVRHRSSYAFFHSVISHDLKSDHQHSDTGVSIADLGFGSGYGCSLLSSIPNSRITGVDIGPECETFARQYYPRSNVGYVIEDLATFIPAMDPFDYVVSRGVLEHVPDGLGLIGRIKFNRRAMIDVPYDEEPGNEHHVLTGIREDAFEHLGECEIFYEDLDGTIYDAARKPPDANMIMVAINAPGMPKVSSFIDFPLAPVRSVELEAASRAKLSGGHHTFETAEELLDSVKKAVKETEVVADIGCGIAPMTYFRPKLHLMIEPYQEYVELLTEQHAGDKGVIILREGALEALRTLTDKAVDSIFLLDVIEHLEKAEGKEVVAECERVTREQIVIFTPLGFMPQHVEAGQTDGWGLSGATFQEHRSGWLPEDFDDKWGFYVCETFHKIDHQGEPLPEPHGAFFAIRNFEQEGPSTQKTMEGFRRAHPSEEALQKLEESYRHLMAKCTYLEESNAALAAEHQSLNEAYQSLNNLAPLRMKRFLHRIIKGRS